MTIASASSIPDAERELRLIRRLMRLYYEARDYKRQFYSVWTRNYRLLNNRMGAPGMAQWMPSPRDPEIFPVIDSLVAWMTDQGNQVEAMAAADPASPSFSVQNTLAEDLASVLRSVSKAEDFDYEVKLCLWDAFTYSVGIGKSVWDNSLAGGAGDASFRRVDPWTFYWDPLATSLRDAESFIEVRRYSYNEIVRRWPQAETWLRDESDVDGIDERPTLAGDVMTGARTNPGSIPQSGQWPGSGSASGTWNSGSTSRRNYEPSPGYVVYEFWIKENEIWFDDHEDIAPDDDDSRPDSEKHVDVRWRCIVVCANNILLDVYADEMWGHKQHPYERYAPIDTGEFVNTSVVEFLSYPQIYINRLLTAAQHNTELAGNPVWIEAANSGLNRVGIINRPGQRLTVSGAAAMQNKPGWVEPPQLPSMLMELIDFYIDRIENISGLSATQKGKVPQQRSAEGTVNQAQEAAMVRVRSMLSNLESFLRRTYYKVADLIVEFYDEPRIITISGSDGQDTAKHLHGNHFMVPGKDGATPLKFSVTINAGSTGPTSRAARIAEGDKLFAMGAVDDQYILELHQVRGIQDLLQRLYQKRQEGLVGSGGSQRQRSGRTQ